MNGIVTLPYTGIETNEFSVELTPAVEGEIPTVSNLKIKACVKPEGKHSICC